MGGKEGGGRGGEGFHFALGFYNPPFALGFYNPPFALGFYNPPFALGFYNPAFALGFYNLQHLCTSKLVVWK